MQAGPYELLAELGRGGMGVVWRARHTELQHEVALKLISSDYLQNATALRRFEREAAAAGRLAGHPGIAGVHDAGTTADGQHYLAMELIEGGSLADRLEEPLTPAQTAEMGEHLARALAHAHGHGILHRDLKPGNVLLGSDGQARITDFGLATQSAAGPEVSRLTKSQEVLGTPAYMPPEQARGMPLDVRADIYSLGATLYECLAGAPAFQGDTILAVLADVLRKEPPPLRSIAPGTPLALDTIIRCCMAKEPDQRYANADDLADDLARFRRGDPIAARVHRPVPWARIGAAAAAVAIVGGVGLGLWWSRMAAGRVDPHAVSQVAQATSLNERALQISQAFRRLASADAGAFDAAVEAAAAAYPGTAVVPAWAGLVQFRAGDEREGLERITAAIQAAPDDPFGQVLLALAHVTSYSQAAAAALSADRSELVYGFETKGFEETPAMAHARTAAAEALAGVSALPLWPLLDDGAPFLEFARAVEALSTETPEAALPHLQALEEHPQLGHDATFLRGVLHYRARSWAKAAQVFAITVGTVAGSAHLASRAWLEAAVEQREVDLAAEGSFAAALRWANVAIETQPRVVRLHYTKAMILHLTQDHLLRSRELHRATAPGSALSPAELTQRRRALLRDAVGSATAAVDLAQGDEAGVCCRMLGIVAHALATVEHAAGLDALPMFREAERALTRALAENPGDASAWGLRGEVRETMSKFVEAQTDTVPMLEAAAADYEFMAGLGVNAGWAYTRVGAMWGNAAYSRLQRSQPVDDLLQRALTAYDKALAAGAEGFEFHIARGYARIIHVKHGNLAPDAIVPMIESAIADIETAARQAPMPKHRFIHGKLSEAYSLRGMVAVQRKQDAARWFNAANRELTMLLERRPDDLELLSLRGQQSVMLSIGRGTQGQDARPDAARGVADLRAVRTLGGETHTTAEFLGRGLVFLGDLDGGIAAYERAIKLAPNRPDLRAGLKSIRQMKRR